MAAVVLQHLRFRTHNFWRLVFFAQSVFSHSQYLRGHRQVCPPLRSDTQDTLLCISKYVLRINKLRDLLEPNIYNLSLHNYVFPQSTCITNNAAHANMQNVQLKAEPAHGIY